MNANELKIGNYYNNNGQIKKITPSDIEEVFISERIWCEPLPITKELLLKFGFNNWLENEYSLSNGYFYCSFKFYKNGRIDTYFCGQNERFKNKDTMFFKYVHQLQNLYFALTGEELTLKTEL
jgi:hypothetical protein